MIRLQIIFDKESCSHSFLISTVAAGEPVHHIYFSIYFFWRQHLKVFYWTLVETFQRSGQSLLSILRSLLYIVDVWDIRGNCPTDYRLNISWDLSDETRSTTFHDLVLTAHDPSRLVDYPWLLTARMIPRIVGSISPLLMNVFSSLEFRDVRYVRIAYACIIRTLEWGIWDPINPTWTFIWEYSFFRTFNRIYRIPSFECLQINKFEIVCDIGMMHYP